MDDLLGLTFKVAMMTLIVTKGDSIKIDISPDGFSEAVTEETIISCTLDDIPSTARNILVMEIIKESHIPIVNMKPPNNIEFVKPKTDHMEVVGMANNTNLASSFLNLTINYPNKDDVGTYSCLVSYLDDVGMVKQETAQFEMKLNATYQGSTESRVENLEIAVSNLLAKVTNLEQEVTDLQAVNQNQSAKIQQLIQNGEKIVAFSASVNHDTFITTGITIVFPDVTVNEGQGYNPTTGIFTVPIDGLYVFHLTMEVGGAGSYSEICIRVADEDKAKLYTQDKDFGDQSAATAVTRVKAGDIVKIVVNIVGGVSPKVLAERLCVFSGFLIHL